SHLITSFNGACRSIRWGGERNAPPRRSSESPGESRPYLAAALHEAAAFVLTRRTTLFGSGNLPAENAAVLAVVVGTAPDNGLVTKVAADQRELPLVVDPAQRHLCVVFDEGVLREAGGVDQGRGVIGDVVQPRAIVDSLAVGQVDLVIEGQESAPVRRPHQSPPRQVLCRVATGGGIEQL